jgi:ribosome-binding protein aMBF1 (putative translation factor)
MITNERQYRVTKSQLQKLGKSLPGNGASKGKLDPRLRAAVRDGLQSQIDELQEQIAEYERLKNSSVSDLKLGSLEELPAVLVKARVAQGMTQKDLARRLGMKEQQIQRYETTRYRSASFKRIVQVAGALGVELQRPTRLPRSAKAKRG